MSSLLDMKKVLVLISKELQGIRLSMTDLERKVFKLDDASDGCDLRSLSTDLQAIDGIIQSIDSLERIVGAAASSCVGLTVVDPSFVVSGVPIKRISAKFTGGENSFEKPGALEVF